MQPPSVPFGQYELIKRIARGGMAEIFLAIERGFEGVNRQVVVKRILPQMAESDDFITMFMDEARVVARINHPNIVHIYSFGEVDGIYYIAMEYVDGVTVSRARRLSQPEQIPVEITLRVIADICAGLHHAHELRDEYGHLLGVVHRDVSPQNVMIARSGVAKLIDFGVARATTQAHATRAGQVKGKFGYIAPEQFHGKTALDRRADIFALGAVLYEMITGQRLFVKESEAATLNAILFEPAERASKHRAVPAMVDMIIQKAVEKDPAQRYATAAEMQQDLEALITRRSYVATQFVVSQFTEQQLAKAADERDSNEARLSAENLLPGSYQSGGVRQTGRSWQSRPSRTPSSIGSSPSGPPRGSLTPPSLASPQAPPSLPEAPSFSPSGVTPGPASDVPRGRGSALVVGIIGAAALLLVAIGVLAGLIIRPQGRGDEGGEASPALTQTGEAPPKNLPFPIDPGDLVPRPTEPVRLSEPPATVDAGGADASTSALDFGDAAQPPPPPDPATKLARPRGKGTLFLNARPWCKVQIAGRDLGITPIIGVELPAGVYTAKLVDANGERHSRRVVITPDQPTKLFVNLQGSEP